jgi:lauroyl/myristoyl acyltransferase
MNLENEKRIYKNQIYNPSQKEIDNASYSLTLFTANIKRFLPGIPPAQYTAMFQEVLYYQKLSGAEQYDREYLRQTQVVNHSSIDLESPPLDTPTIFATFHLGSYRLLNSVLYENGFKIVVIIDETVFLNQQEKLLRSVKSVLKGKSTSDLIILNVNDRTSIFRLKQLLEKGYVMTVYLDGNTGINAKSQDFSKGYIPIDFLDKQIYVKNGIGKLAALLDGRVVPVVSYRDEQELNHVEFYKEIAISDFEDRKAFSVKAIELAYKKLEEKLVQYPTQWECWLYIQKWFKRDYSTPFVQDAATQNRFNDERYSTFVVNESNFIFDLLDYQSFPIDTALANALRENDFAEVDAEIFNTLKEKNIVV